MKTLSVKDPWAFLIIKGLKDVENRTWKTKYRGKLLIHVSQKLDNEAFDFISMNDLLSKGQSYDLINHLMNTSKGAIIGEVNIIDCIQNSKSKWAVDGQYHWVLDKPVHYNTYILDVKGKLGIWNYTL